MSEPLLDRIATGLLIALTIVALGLAISLIIIMFTGGI